ncbi:MAG: response regulator [Acidobacteriaceae bacterium]|jgi:PAS domain S-box-containing protein
MATILIVDDRPENRAFLATLLGRAGYSLLQAADGAEALALARAEQPELLIADILMPTMDGYELVRQLRADRQIAQTPVIFWTAHYHEQQAKVLARKCGVSQVITKPSSGEVILNAVRAALNGAISLLPSPNPNAEIDRDHLRLLTDTLSHKVDDLSAANGRLTALIELDTQLASETDLHKLIETFGNAARRIIGARHSMTGILTADGKGFRSVFTSGMDAQTSARLGSPDPQAVPLKAILIDRRSIHLHNPGGNPVALGFPASHPPIHGWLGVPIASPTRIYGYIGLVDKIGLDEFSKEDERLATILAAQVGRIYQNGSLSCEVLRQAACLEREISCREEAEKALAEDQRQGELISEAHAALVQSNTEAEMLERCAQSIVRNLDAALARVWTFNEVDQSLTLKASVGLDAGIDASFNRIQKGKFLIGQIAQESAPFVTNDLPKDPIAAPKGWMTRNRITSFAGYPLVIEDHLVGVLAVYGHQPFTGTTTEIIASVGHKITLGIERFRTHDGLRAREEHIRLLLDAKGEGIYGTDKDGFCTFANSEAARLLGYEDPSKLHGQNMHGLAHHTRPDGSPLPLGECRIYQAARNGQADHVNDEVFWRADGSSFPVEYWSNPIYREGRMDGVVVTFLDISDRTQLENKIRQNEQRLRHIVSSSPSVLYTAVAAQNQFGDVTWTSDNLMEITGYQPEATLAVGWWQSKIHPDDMAKVKAEAEAKLFSRGQCTADCRFRHQDGTYRWIRHNMRLIRNKAGQPLEIVGAFTDITELKRSEDEHGKVQIQLDQALKLESIGQLAGGIAHDFNNLLGIIIGYVEMIHADLPGESNLREYTDDVLKAAKRAADLTAQLLAFSRQQVLQPTVLSLNTLSTYINTMLRRIIPENIEISMAFNSVGLVRVDAGQIEQVVTNLVVNSRDAMPTGGRLFIETKDVELDETYVAQHPDVKAGPYVMLAVTDSGCGMTPEVMARIFEPFFTTKGLRKGTGLGLGTVHGIVKQSGGSIYVYSEPGRGTTFKIYLPRLQDAEDTPATEPQELEMSFGNETVLVAEDEPSLRKLVCEVLHRLGYAVLAAENGEDALHISSAHEGPIHLLVTDLIMPKVGGRELADLLTKLRPALQVLYISGYTDDRTIAQGVYSNQIHFLQKPVTRVDLAQKVRTVLDSVSPSADGSMETYAS